MAKKKLTIDDIFNDDDFGLLDSKVKSSTVKTDEDRLIDSFEEINVFIDKNEREPNKSSMSEYGLMAKLKNFRENEDQKKILKPYDRHNLLGHVEIEEQSIDDILNDEDEFGLLHSDKDLDIFKFKHTPKPENRAEADFVAQRKPMKEKEFEKYEKMFLQVHKEIKEGKRDIVGFNYESLKVGEFYIADGIMLYLKDVNWDRKIQKFKSGIHDRPDGRTVTIFENGTKSNMNFQSLYKLLHGSSGKMITKTNDQIEQDLFVNSGLVKEGDVPSGWIYALQTKSSHPELSSMKDLYKIGFSSTPVLERIKNAKNEATYLFSDVKNLKAWKVYNRNADKLENLLHRFFANACLDIDLFNEKGQRLNPREWFVVPLEVIEEAIHLCIKENIIYYRYDAENRKIKLKV
ncbi:T5orf172 domain-containing protein [Flavobacteriaceae bacterium MAR_2009_75]|nr:T5orf172 domain-containing protein [Flavobacteriaceae bacterium MAR_2009_75]